MLLDQARKTIDEKNKKAVEALKPLADKAGAIDFQTVYKAVSDYIRYKFELQSGDMNEDNLIALAEVSLMRIAGQARHILAQKDCHGVTSSMDKKILLLMTLQKDVGIHIPISEYPRMATVTGLSRVIFEHIRT